MARIRSTSLYIVSEATYGPVKVGITDHLNKRVSNLQCGNPRRLSLHCSFEFASRQDAEDVERATLIAFRIKKLWLGGEWISASPTEAEASISALLAEADIAANLRVSPSQGGLDG